MSENVTRITLEQAKKLKSLSVAKKANNLSEEEIDKIIEDDPDLYQLTDKELKQFTLAKENPNEQ